MVKKEYYIDKEEMMYETILSQGKCKVTDKLSVMLWTLVERYAHAWNWYDEDIKQDAMQHAFIDAFLSYNKVDLSKNAFTYYTQVIKIAFYWILNQWKYEKPTNDRYKAFIKLSYDKEYMGTGGVTTWKDAF